MWMTVIHKGTAHSLEYIGTKQQLYSWLFFIMASNDLLMFIETFQSSWCFMTYFFHASKKQQR